MGIVMAILSAVPQIGALLQTLAHGNQDQDQDPILRIPQIPFLQEILAAFEDPEVQKAGYALIVAMAAHALRRQNSGERVTVSPIVPGAGSSAPMKPDGQRVATGPPNLNLPSHR